MSRSLIKRGENKGFTLMEVLIAIVVLSVALLALAGLQINSIQRNSFGNHMTEAITLAKDKMEEMKNAEWDQIVDKSGDHQKGDVPAFYHWECTVTQSGKIKTVTVTVTWENGAHSAALVTKIPDLRVSP